VEGLDPNTLERTSSPCLLNKRKKEIFASWGVDRAEVNESPNKDSTNEQAVFGHGCPNFPFFFVQILIRCVF
jgi:hypothetical protein